MEKDYYFQFYYDDLPIWGYVGKVETVKPAEGDGEEKKKLFLFTHIHFDISYNKNRVIEINVATDPTQVVELSEGSGEQDVAFTYSVTWKASTLPFSKRMDKYRRYQFLKQHLEVICEREMFVHCLRRHRSCDT